MDKTDNNPAHSFERREKIAEISQLMHALDEMNNHCCHTICELIDEIQLQKWGVTGPESATRYRHASAKDLYDILMLRHNDQLRSNDPILRAKSPSAPN